MSRGLGRTERAVLATLDYFNDSFPTPAKARRAKNWFTLEDVTDDANDGWRPTRAQAESVRRAIRTLRAKRLVRVRHKTFPGTVKLVVKLTDAGAAVVEAAYARLDGQDDPFVALENLLAEHPPPDRSTD